MVKKLFFFPILRTTKDSSIKTLTSAKRLSGNFQQIEWLISAGFPSHTFICTCNTFYDDAYPQIVYFSAVKRDGNLSHRLSRMAKAN